jgi:protein tyrosine phosphatase (PTP) superfamily phosphohydrolase (DUF442 family)
VLPKSYLALALITALSSTAFAEPAALKEPAALVISVPGGIPRFVEVEPGFARGGQPSEEGIRALATRGYRTVVSLRHDDVERERVRAAGMEYVEIPMKCGLFGAPAPSRTQARAFLSAVGDSAKRPVFVHCHHGRDRTGVMVALYRVARNGWTAERAITEMKERGIRPQYRAYRRYIRTLDPKALAAYESL